MPPYRAGGHKEAIENNSLHPPPVRDSKTTEITLLECCDDQKCPSQLLGIRWYDRVWNDEVLQRTGLTSLSHLLSRRRISVFGHVARLDDDTPANMALQLHINVSLNRPPDRTWRHPPGRPRNKWLDHLRNDPTQPISWLTQPNPLQVEKIGLNPTQPNTTTSRAYSLIVTYFYTQNLSRTFSQPSINLFMFFTDRALNALT